MFAYFITSKAISNFDSDASSLSFYYMLREQTLTFSHGIPELYLWSAEDWHLQNNDPKCYFITRRQAIASNGVSPITYQFLLSFHYSHTSN